MEGRPTRLFKTSSGCSQSRISANSRDTTRTEISFADDPAGRPGIRFNLSSMFPAEADPYAIAITTIPLATGLAAFLTNFVCGLCRFDWGFPLPHSLFGG